MPANRPDSDARIRRPESALDRGQSKLPPIQKQDRLRPPNPKPFLAVKLNRLPVQQSLNMVDAMDLLLQKSASQRVHGFFDGGQQLQLEWKQTGAGSRGHYADGAMHSWLR